MIVDTILRFIYGCFDAFFGFLNIPEVPDWYTTEIFPTVALYVRQAVKLVSFAFPSELWVWLVRFTKDMILIRICYDLFKKFYPVHTSS